MHRTNKGDPGALQLGAGLFDVVDQKPRDRARRGVLVVPVPRPEDLHLPTIGQPEDREVRLCVLNVEPEGPPKNLVVASNSRVRVPSHASLLAFMGHPPSGFGVFDRRKISSRSVRGTGYFLPETVRSLAAQ